MKVLGIDMYDRGMENAISEFIATCRSEPKNLIVSPSDANVLVHARSNPSFENILKSCHWNLPDGMPSVWVLKWKGAKQASRCSGPEFFKQVMIQTRDLPIKHYLCGGTQDTVSALAKVCETWGNNNVVGIYSPPFKPIENQDFDQISEMINTSGADVVWVGLGAPKQIYFANELAQKTKVSFLVTIGAAFDFHTGRVRKAPKWIQSLGMEWAFRWIMEPRRLSKRYLNAVPKFIWYNLKDLLS